MKKKVQGKWKFILLALLILSLVPAYTHVALGVDASTQQWTQTMLSSRISLRSSGGAGNAAQQKNAWTVLCNNYAPQCDWAKQDYSINFYVWFGKAASDTTMERSMIQKVITELGSAGSGFQTELNALVSSNVSGDDARWLDLYGRSCEQRRTKRLAPLLAKTDKIIFAKHFNFMGSFYAYTEAQSDDRAEYNFSPGSALCELKMEGIFGTVSTLLNSTTGVIRDPDISSDGSKILFSHKKSDGDDYHLYEMNYATKQVRQLTSGAGFADYEGIYLPDGNIMFNSTRVVQSVDCWITPVSNFYIMDGNGAYMRRIGYDQVHTNYPTMAEDGRVIYTRWEYNDRGQMMPQEFFQMNPDGTNQTAVYKSNSGFPVNPLHIRAIPGTTKYISTFTGHHTPQAGKLGIIDPSKGREENQGARLIAPVRDTPAERIDGYGQSGEMFQYPYPVTEKEFLVSYAPEGWAGGDNKTSTHFGLYFMDMDGRRELLAYDRNNSCNQGVPLNGRPVLHVRPNSVDYRKSTGTYYVGDIYKGPGLEGVPRGTIKSLRVVGMEYRAASIGVTQNDYPAFFTGHVQWSSGNYCPPSVGNGSWDPKKVLGTVPVYEDGSALFSVPARVPVYFQALDEKGRMVQTMRSWSTLQPGETYSCVGCHENKNTTPPVNGKPTMAMNAGVQTLQPSYDLADGFSFTNEIQPILDAKCISCHTNKSKVGNGDSIIDTTGAAAIIPKASQWQYRETDPGSGWELPEFNSSGWAAAQAPFGQGGIAKTTWNTQKIWMRKTFDVTGSMLENKNLVLNFFHDEDCKVYINGIKVSDRPGYLTEYQNIVLGPAGSILKTGRNTIAVYCKDTTGGRMIDVSLLNCNVSGAPVSLKGDVTLQSNGAIFDERSERKWTDSYLALTHARMVVQSSGFRAGAQGSDTNYLVNWISAQSEPDLQPPYQAGSNTSGLIKMLENHHGGVTLTDEEMDKIETWIDLGVPFCATYEEANNWTSSEISLYQQRMNKRRNMEALEQSNIQALINYLNP